VLLRVIGAGPVAGWPAVAADLGRRAGVGGVFGEVRRGDG
jgi:hypothetical protein